MQAATDIGSENRIGMKSQEGSGSLGRTAFWVLLSGVCYYLATKIAWSLCLSESKVSLLFPPHAVLVSVLLLVPTRHWWAYVLAAVCAHLVAAQQAHWPLLFALQSEAFDAVQSVPVAAGIRIFIKSPFNSLTLRDAVVFVLIAVIVVPFGTAFWGAAFTVSNHYGTYFWVEWRKLGIANGVTAVVLVPAILLGVSRLSAGWAKATPGRLLEAGFLAAGILTIGTLAFDYLPAGPGTSPDLLYAPVPLLVWAALRFGLGGMSASMLVITFQAIGGAMRGHGPFLAQTPAENALSLQTFLVVTATPLMFLAVGVEEEKRSQRALRESEARFRGVADAAPVLIWMSGPDKRCNFFNKNWLDFTGRALEQELGDGWAEGVHPDDLAECLKDYIESFDARRPFTLEYRLRRHDGEYRWISDNGVPRYDSGRNFLGYIGSCVDLTDRRQSEERFRLVVEASPNGIILANDHGWITLVNAQTERLFGYPRTELIGQSAGLLMPERWRDQFQHNLNRFREAPSVRMMGVGRELLGRRKDGTEFPLEIGLSPVQGQDGKQFLAVIVDITARKEAEAETLRQRNQLAHVTRVTTMGQLASSLAHELNQPLGAIMRNAEAAELLLLEASPDLDEVRASLADIRKDDQRAGDVIDRMRALMKRGEVQRLPVDLNAMAGEVITLVRPDAYIRRVRLALETDAALPPVIGDRVQLQQVMLNLVLNGMEALKDNPPGNRLVVMRARPSGTAVEVAVSDNGNGIPEDKLARIFEPFFSSKPGGLGMGLSISRNIVAAHRGRLWAENNAGGGATFRFTLPIGEEEEDLFDKI
jgi:two-component system, LuxR family, sensor kinase FixL